MNYCLCALKAESTGAMSLVEVGLLGHIHTHTPHFKALSEPFILYSGSSTPYYKAFPSSLSKGHRNYNHCCNYVQLLSPPLCTWKHHHWSERPSSVRQCSQPFHSGTAWPSPAGMSTEMPPLLKSPGPTCTAPGLWVLSLPTPAWSKGFTDGFWLVSQ